MLGSPPGLSAGCGEGGAIRRGELAKLARKSKSEIIDARESCPIDHSGLRGLVVIGMLAKRLVDHAPHRLNEIAQWLLPGLDSYHAPSERRQHLRAGRVTLRLFDFRSAFRNRQRIAGEVSSFTMSLKMETLLEEVLHHELELRAGRSRRHRCVHLVDNRTHVVHDPGRAADLIEFHSVSSHHQREHSDATEVNPAGIVRSRSSAVSEDSMRRQVDDSAGFCVNGACLPTHPDHHQAPDD